MIVILAAISRIPNRQAFERYVPVRVLKPSLKHIAAVVAACKSSKPSLYRVWCRGPLLDLVLMVKKGHFGFPRIKFFASFCLTPYNQSWSNFWSIYRARFCLLLVEGRKGSRRHRSSARFKINNTIPTRPQSSREERHVITGGDSAAMAANGGGKQYVKNIQSGTYV